MPRTVYYVVETAFEELQKDFTGDTLQARCLLEQVAELTFEHAIGVFGFLLLAELYTVFRCLATLVGAMLARGKVASCEYFVFAEIGSPNLRAILVLGPVYLAIVVKISLFGSRRLGAIMLRLILVAQPRP